MVSTRLTALLFALATSAYAQKLSIDGQYTIVSPKDYGIYVAGQILPLTYDLTDATPSGFHLKIYLDPADATVNFTSTLLQQDAPVSKDASSALKAKDNSTVYEHTINYALPVTTPPGQYQVIYEATNTATNTSIPITINAAVKTTTTPAAAATNSGGSPAPSNAKTKDDGSSASRLIGTSLVGLIATAGLSALLGL